MNRVIGQCGVMEWEYLDHLVDVIARGDNVNAATLTNRQRMAVLVMRNCQLTGIPFKTLRKVREVLVLKDDKSGKVSLEYKLLNPADRDTASLLMNAKPH